MKVRKSVAAMIRSLDHFPMHARRDAILTLGEVGAEDGRTREALLKLINKNDQDIRAEDAAAVIGALAYQEEATPVLLEILLKHRSSNCRISAAIALARIKPPPPQLLPAMVVAAEDADPQVRHQALTFLGNLQPPAVAIVPQLVEIYGRAQPSERRLIEQLILRLDSEGQVAIPTLTVASDSYPDEVRQDMTNFLQRFRGHPSTSTEKMTELDIGVPVGHAESNSLNCPGFQFCRCDRGMLANTEAHLAGQKTIPISSCLTRSTSTNWYRNTWNIISKRGRINRWGISC